jgi:hypothetical protein
MTRFPDFGKELQRPFEVHENCSDCAEFYGPGHGVPGCNAWPASKDFACLDFLRLPDVGVNGQTGQEFPPSRMGGRKEPRIRRPTALEQATAGPPAIEAPPTDPPTRRPGQPGELGARICGCGGILPKGKRLCDTCRAEHRRRTLRQYMRGYMVERRSGAIRSNPDVPFPGRGTHTTQPGGFDLRSRDHPAAGGYFDPTSVLTSHVPENLTSACETCAHSTTLPTLSREKPGQPCHVIDGIPLC